MSALPEMPFIVEVKRVSLLKGNTLPISGGTININNHQRFDAPLAVLECRNFARTMKLHLSRCDDPHTAKEIHEVLKSLSDGFARKI